MLDIKINIVIFLLFGLAIFLGPFIQYFNDKKVFSKFVARRNFYYLIPYATIGWIFVSLCYSAAYYYPSQNQSKFTSSNILNFLTCAWLFAILVLPRIIIKFFVNQKMGEPITNCKKNLLLTDFFNFLMCSYVFPSQLAIVLFHDPVSSIIFLVISIFTFNLLAVLLDGARLTDQIEFREQGICGSYFAIKWDQIEAYKWTLSDDAFHILHKSFWPISRHLKLQFLPEGKDEVIELLDSHLSHQSPE